MVGMDGSRSGRGQTVERVDGWEGGGGSGPGSAGKPPAWADTAAAAAMMGAIVRPVPSRELALVHPGLARQAGQRPGLPAGSPGERASEERVVGSRMPARFGLAGSVQRGASARHRVVPHGRQGAFEAGGVAGGVAQGEAAMRARRPSATLAEGGPVGGQLGGDADVVVASRAMSSGCPRRCRGSRPRARGGSSPRA
jgi:hypothetical protein